MQVIIAGLESNCTPGTTLCAWDYSPYPITYYGGPQYFPNMTVSESHLNPLSNYGPYESYDSINLTSNSESFKAAGSFSDTLPPVPTPAPGTTPTPRKKPASNPCAKNPRLCEVVIAPSASPTPSGASALNLNPARMKAARTAAFIVSSMARYLVSLALRFGKPTMGVSPLRRRENESDSRTQGTYISAIRVASSTTSTR